MPRTPDRQDGEPNPDAVLSRLRKALREVEGCLHPDAPVGCTSVINAHSLQKNGPLAHLKDQGNHVYTFSPFSKLFFATDPDRVGWNEASTFRGLCHAHDQIFGPLENADFSTTAEQVFLAGYRGAYLELHEKRAGCAACDKVGYADMAVLRPDDMDPKMARQLLRVHQWGRRRGLKEMRTFKAVYDAAWRARNFGAVSSCVVRFEGRLAVASAGVVSPDHDATGIQIQQLHLPGMQSLAFGTVATAGGGAIVFTWPSDMHLMRHFVDSLINLPRKNLPGALLMFMFSYVSNTFFQPAWWNELRSSARVRLSEAGRNPQQYYTPVSYLIGTVVDWTITGVDFQ